MRIGDSVFVHGYVDEIRQDCVIIRNKGGYFGTAPSEVIETINELPSAEAVHKPDYSYEAGMVRRLKEALSADAEDRLYIKIYADDEPSVKAEKLYQICGETQNREVAEWLKEYFPSAEAEEYEDYEHATLVDIKEPLKVEVVRCKDCRHWNSETNGCKRNPSVEAWYEDDFCKYGERRTK